MPLLVAVAYVVFAKVGFSLAFATKQVTAVWPPTGVALAALILFGNRVWPGIFVGAFVSNAISGEPLWTAALIACTNTLGPLTGATLMRRFDFDMAMERLRDVLTLVAFGAAVSMTITATFGVAFLALSSIVPWQNYLGVWWVWWAGDVMGVLIFAPLAFTWMRSRSHADGRIPELIILALATFGVAWFSFLGALPMAYPVYPFVMWTAVRFRQRATAVAVVLICLLAIWATIHQMGPFRNGAFDIRLTLLVTYMGILSVTGFTLGAVTAERRLAATRLRDAADTLKTAFLPDRMPRRDDLFCESIYLTAGEEALIGGDWYDAFELPSGAVVISIGDVAGHGFEAAVSAARIRQAIFASAFDVADPAAILDKVDGMLRVQQEHAVATALVAVIEQDLMTMRYASAGHPPPIFARPGEPAHALPYGGIPLGISVGKKN